MNEILFRLIKDGKVVGYEKHEDGNILHAKKSPHNSLLDYFDILTVTGYDGETNFYIPHDRKDLWTGLEDKNGRKIFEMDRAKRYDLFFVIGYSERCCWFFAEQEKPGFEAPYYGGISGPELRKIEVIGIEGVEE